MGLWVRRRTCCTRCGIVGVIGLVCLLTNMGRCVAVRRGGPSAGAGFATTAVSHARPHSTTAATALPLIRVTRVGAKPFAIATDERTGRVFVVNQGPDTGKGSVSVLDATTGAVLATVPLGLVTYGGSDAVTAPLPPQSIAVDERTRRVFVLSVGALDPVSSAPRGRGFVRVLDAATGRVIRTTAVGNEPEAIAVDATTGRAFVVNNRDASMSLLDAATGRAVGLVAVGTPHPVAIATAERAGHVFVSSGGGSLTTGGAVSPTITIFDGRRAMRRRVVGINGVVPTFGVDERANRVVVGFEIDRYDSEVDVLDAASGKILHRLALPGPPAYPLAVDSATGCAVLYGEPSYTGGATFVSVLDMQTGRILHTTRSNLRGDGSPLASASINTVTGHALVATQDAGATHAHLDIIDLRTGRLARAVTVGRGAPVVTVDGRARRVFVLNPNDETVTILDATSL